MRTPSLIILVAAACSSPQKSPNTPPPQPEGTVVEWEVHGQEPGGDPSGHPSGAGTSTAAGTPAAGVDRTKPQPPAVKLKLGHFTNAKLNIGLVIDRTNKEARVKFDHVPEVMHLDPMQSSRRIDYVKTINEVVLQVYDNGRVVVNVPGTSESIDVVRDGDADPL